MLVLSNATRAFSSCPPFEKYKRRFQNTVQTSLITEIPLNCRYNYSIAGFMKTREKTSHPFFKQFLKTQMFIKFIEERSFVSGNDEKFAFFDECVDKVGLRNDALLGLLSYMYAQNIPWPVVSTLAESFSTL